MSSLIDTNVFDYVNVLDKAMDASYIRNEAISNNLANADTPGYKRQDVNFETQLAKALRHSRYKSMDAKVADLKVNRLKPITYTDYSGFSYRIDGNNVDPDTEGVYLAKNQVVYQGLYQSTLQEFKNLQSVMK
ncbi:MAG: flagellar basal body rod protein FlgB [Bacteroidales bacterium]|nr:flagellar basal body rod protein FlgB [Bacteroidales bacterium]MCM1415133.1 flagellar basal body rod protein FlgB [bacterium]MCM1423031.1 flagellar basal body rod protein FlgB [bacterium]